MILVDTSVWVDHLHAVEADLVADLEAGEVVTHPFVIEELALGSIARRGAFLTLLGNLDTLRPVTHDEVVTLVERHRLFGRGLSMVDVHLLGSVRIAPGCALWTRDRRLADACRMTHTPLVTR